MKNKLASALLFGWYFAFAVEHPKLEGIDIVSTVGDFATEKACNRERDRFMDSLDGMPGVTWTKCIKAEET